MKENCFFIFIHIQFWSFIDLFALFLLGLSIECKEDLEGGLCRMIVLEWFDRPIN